MKIELVQALETLRQNCRQYQHECFGCDLFSMKTGCYLYDKAPEEYDIDRLEEEVED